MPETNKTEFKLGYRPSLDGLRGVAVLAVMTLHAYVTCTVPILREKIDLLGVGGFLGVDVFFVLSGFLITTLLLQEWQRNGEINFKKFYARRALRLLPVLFVYLFFSIGYTIIFRSAEESVGAFRDVIIIVFYVSNWVNINVYTLRHAWSLAVEEQFYLLWPLLLVGMLLLVSRLKLKRHWVILFLLIVISLVAVHRAFMFAHSGFTMRVYQGLDTRADGLLVGCCVALLLTWYTIPKKVWLLRAIKVMALASVILLLYLGLMTRITDGYLYYGVSTLVAFSVGLTIVSLLVSPLKFVTRILEWSALVWIGRISYGLYLWHKLVYSVLDHTLPPISVPSETLRLMVLPLTIKFGVSILVAGISFYFIEQPFLLLKKRFTVIPAADTVSGRDEEQNQKTSQPVFPRTDESGEVVFEG